MMNRVCSGKPYAFRLRRPEVKISTGLNPRQSWCIPLVAHGPLPFSHSVLGHSTNERDRTSKRQISPLPLRRFAAVTLCQTALRAKTDGRFLGREGGRRPCDQRRRLDNMARIGFYGMVAIVAAPLPPIRASQSGRRRRRRGPQPCQRAGVQ